MDAATAREQDLFDAALLIPAPAERDAFLDKSCADDPALRNRMTKLLAAHSESERYFIECITGVARGAGDSLRSASTDRAGLTAATGEKPGARIGPYQILRSLGEGGCGEVYLAEQMEPVRRQVALKVIKPGMDTKSVIARFEAERQALALMDHPNIARVLDAGATEAGRPFFVMELVHGLRVTEYCDKHFLDLSARLQLFIQICNAIQHAHHKGIIHRDIKPSNVLVTIQDGVPVPKVIDFGIAKFIEINPTDKTFSTVQGQIIGTPAYMSPEQANRGGLDVDTRSDIYSLGVLLYELLTGRPPFDQKKLLGSGWEEIRRTLMEKEPPRPSAAVAALPGDELLLAARRRGVEPRRLVPLLHGELDWIVMKALEKDRQRRYQTANGLALDVRRYLGNETVSACPPSRIYQLQKLIRRNKMAFGFSLAILLALVAGLGTSLVMYVREREARNIADQLRIEAEHGRASESQLRHEAEAREKIIQAAALLRSNLFEEADRLISAIPQNEQIMEGAPVFRRLGDWHASRGEWQPAARDYIAVARANVSDGLDLASLDYAAEALVLIMTKDQAAYDQFRRESIRRFADTSDPTVAERILKSSLLIPATPQLMVPLRRQAEYLATYVTGVSSNYPWMATWQYAALGLYYYRAGQFAEGASACKKCLEYKDAEGPPSVRVTYANLVLAMCQWQQGYVEDGQIHFEIGNKNVQEIKQAGDPQGSSSGNWFEWVFAQILREEASGIANHLRIKTEPGHVNEILSRQDVEAGEIFSQAAAMLRGNHFEEADRLVSTIPQKQQLTGGAAVFRSLGGWHAIRGEWQAAALDFAAVEQANQSDGLDTASFDYAADTTVRIMAKDLAGYDSLRRESIRRFAGTSDPGIAERFLQNSLLTPAPPDLIAQLRPQAEFLASYVIGVSTNQPWLAAWQNAGLGLYYYREGQFAQGAMACKKSLEYNNPDGLPSARVTYANLVLAMCEWQQGHVENARVYFDIGNKHVEDIRQAGYPPGSTSGNWFDWVFAQILRDEARTLLKQN